MRERIRGRVGTLSQALQRGHEPKVCRHSWQRRAANLRPPPLQLNSQPCPRAGSMGPSPVPVQEAAMWRQVGGGGRAACPGGRSTPPPCAGPGWGGGAVPWGADSRGGACSHALGLAGEERPPAQTDLSGRPPRAQAGTAQALSHPPVQGSQRPCSPTPNPRHSPSEQSISPPTHHRSF